ncbi:hypothetical protein TUBRATIS_003870 [Tubulinosema ratisbonensis]|uniref:Uncharacterized protein n=1 Tax=Tubulinosema ratisbonensis TaxID=291195 RepID=A0A437APP5_9MICR|nr:hypothetical protein TUBRATIS_003870 [Tubulinosema ratisbonensis]
MSYKQENNSDNSLFDSLNEHENLTETEITNLKNEFQQRITERASHTESDDLSLQPNENGSFLMLGEKLDDFYKVVKREVENAVEEVSNLPLDESFINSFAITDLEFKGSPEFYKHSLANRTDEVRRLKRDLTNEDEAEKDTQEKTDNDLVSEIGSPVTYNFELFVVKTQVDFIRSQYANNQTESQKYYLDKMQKEEAEYYEAIYKFIKSNFRMASNEIKMLTNYYEKNEVYFFEEEITSEDEKELINQEIIAKFDSLEKSYKEYTDSIKDLFNCCVDLANKLLPMQKLISGFYDVIPENKNVQNWIGDTVHKSYDSKKKLISLVRYVVKKVNNQYKVSRRTKTNCAVKYSDKIISEKAHDECKNKTDSMMKMREEIRRIGNEVRKKIAESVNEERKYLKSEGWQIKDN